MGHTQWMPEVWLHLGVDYDHDGKLSPFGRPDDALATTARYLVERGNYRRGEPWGHEVRAPDRSAARNRAAMPSGRSLASCAPTGRLSRSPTPPRKLWVPVPGGPAFLLGPNFYAVRTYNPSMNYTLAIVHLGDRCTGGEAFVQSFPGQRARADTGRSAGNPAPPHRARLRHRRRRRPCRQRHHARRPRLSAQGRHGSGRRLCRNQACSPACARARDPVRSHPARPEKIKIRKFEESP